MQRLPDIAISELHLDLENPRLPESLSDRSEVGVLRHLFRTAALDELAESIRVNGYFPSEPLIVSEPGEMGSRTVLEGNRRLATVLILVQDPRAIEAGASFTEPVDQAVVDGLAELPALEADPEDEDFQAFLGYRHISGLRMWGAGEKARFIWSEVHRLEPKFGDQVFYSLGRIVGSNARGVRSAYVAYELLQYARREGVDGDLVTQVLSDRFGVWVRLLGTKNAGSFIELSSAGTLLKDVRSAIAGVDLANLERVLRDLVPSSGRSVALIADSRQVTAYSDVLGLPSARELMWKAGDLDLAVALARRPEVDGQLQRVADQLRVITDLVADGADITPETPGLIDRVVKAARLLSATVGEFFERPE